MAVKIKISNIFWMEFSILAFWPPTLAIKREIGLVCHFGHMGFFLLDFAVSGCWLVLWCLDALLLLVPNFEIDISNTLT